MKRHLCRTCLMILIIALSAGCTGKKGVNNFIVDPQLNHEDAGFFAYIVMGIESKNAAPLSCLFSLNLNGENVGMQGIAVPGSKELPLGFSINNHVQYYKTQGLSYLLWRVPASALDPASNDALIYINSVGGSDEFLSKKLIYFLDGFVDFPFFSRPKALNIYPLIGTPNPLFNIRLTGQVQDEPPVTNFECSYFDVRPGNVYYLGDALLDAKVSVENLGHKEYLILLEQFKIQYRSNEEEVSRFLSTRGIRSKTLVNLSGDWARRPIALYYEHTRKKLKKE